MRARRLELGRVRSICQPSRPPCRRTASTAGCSTISAASTRLPPTSRRRAPGRPPGDAALVLPDSGRRRAARRWSTPSNRTRSPICPARPNATPAASSSRPGFGSCSPASGAWRWSTRRDARSRTSRASTPAPSSWSGSAASRSCRRAISSSAFPPSGTTREIATHLRGVRQAAPDQGSRVRGDRAPDARRRADDRVRHPAAHGRLVRGRRAGQRLGPDGVGAGERRQPALSSDGGGVSRAIGARRTRAARSLGQARPARARFTPISPGWVTRAAGAGARQAERSRRSPAARDAAVALVQNAAQAGTDRARLGSRPRGLDACCATPATAHRSCIGPDTAWAKRCTATASTWTTTKRTTTGACCPAPALRSSPASTFRTSASGPKST